MEEKIIVESELSKVFLKLSAFLCVVDVIVCCVVNSYMTWAYYSMIVWLVCCGVLLAIVLLNIPLKQIKMVVTDKRVYGRTLFGKQVDLPLDSISAVSTSILDGISVATSSGIIQFCGLKNRDEIYNEIKKILAERQSKEVKASTSVTNITQEQSSADELKKFKDLLDGGIITQEEFDTKKKQLLGL